MEGVILGIDYGDVRIGLAITDRDQRHVLAHSILEATPREMLFTRLRELVDTEVVERIVVGLPLLLDGTEGEQARKTRVFADELVTQCARPVEFIDERFTSSGGMALARLKGDTRADAEAARLILETWLAQRARRP